MMTCTPLRLLIVEDNHDAAESLRLLFQLQGYDVTVAYDGLNGVRLAREQHPEVILCDLGLPGLDGFDVAKAVRRNPDTATVPLIAVSGYGGEDDRRRSREAGFNHHLTKPADPDELQSLIVRLVTRNTPS
jgi:CheY-like chemotaxis protein